MGPPSERVGEGFNPSAGARFEPGRRQKVVNPGPELRVLRAGCTRGITESNLAGAAVSVEVGREVSLQPDVPGEISCYRSLNSVSFAWFPDTPVSL